MTIADVLARAGTADIAFVDGQNKWHHGNERERGRPDQILPLEGWSTTLAMAGRGWGKTRVGAEWVFRQGGLYPGVIIHVIAPTYSDLRGVVFEGPSGLTAVIPRVCIQSLTYSPYPELVLWNGSTIRGFSSETPDRLRGPQATFVWGDELAAWYRAEECLSNIDFSTRIAYRTGDGKLVQPQKLYTTTPRPLQFLVEMIEKKRPDGTAATVVIRGSTLDNRDNLAENFFTDLMQYEGTQIGRQEIYGELLDISESAIIKKSWLKLWPADKPFPWYEYIMVSMDTAFTEKTYDKKTFSSDPTACTVWGVFQQDKKWNLLLLNCWEDWLGFPELVKRAKKEMELLYGRRTHTLFQPLVGQAYHQDQIKKPDLLVIEEKGSGISLRQMMLQEGVETFPYNPGRADKLSRLHAVSHFALHGRIWLPESENDKGKAKSWIEPMLKQLCTYSGPGTTPHDDWIDSCSQAWRVFGDKFLTDGIGTNKQDIFPERASIVIPTNNPEFEYNYDIESGRVASQTVVAPYD
jgi:predicted phage terminase large subunit-like protein